MFIVLSKLNNSELGFYSWLPLSYNYIRLSYIFFQSFASRPHVFVSVKYTRNTKPNDAMYVWLENVNSGGFEVCIREFLPFDGKHQDTVVVSELEVFGAVKSPLDLITRGYSGRFKVSITVVISSSV